MNKFAAILLAIGAFVAVGEAISPLGSQLRSVRLQKQQPQNEVTDNNNFCQGCRSMVSFMTHFNSTMNREYAKETLKSYCELYYPTTTDFRQGPCPMFVESVFYLMGRIDPVFHCDHIGACDSTNSLVSASENVLGDGGVICDVCEQVVTQVQGELEDPRTIEIIKHQADSFCDYLIVIGQSKQCRQMVEAYIEQLITFVKQLEPLKYCQSISMCSATKPQVPKLNSLANFQGFGLETKVTLGNKVVKNIDATQPTSSVKPRKLTSGPNCKFCKLFVEEMFKFLKDNRTEANVRTGLDKVCKLVYGRNQAKLEHCEMMVASYSREFVQLLVEETDPELICMLLDQCTYQEQTFRNKELADDFAPESEDQVAGDTKVASIEPIDMSTFVSLLDSDIQPGSTRTCLECKLFIEYLQNQVKDPKSQEEIKQWLLTNLCQTLEEKSLKNSCDQLIEKYAETFFKAVSNELNPKETCQELNACKRQRMVPMVVDNAAQTAKQQQKTTNVIASSTTVAPKSSVCDQCVQIVTQLDEYLSGHSVDHDVSVLIDQVCNQLPSDTMKQECTLLVKTFGDEITQAIATMDNPKQLCASIYMC